MQSYHRDDQLTRSDGIGQWASGFGRANSVFGDAPELQREGPFRLECIGVFAPSTRTLESSFWESAV